jgi:hypothetical protein
MATSGSFGKRDLGTFDEVRAMTWRLLNPL